MPIFYLKLKIHTFNDKRCLFIILELKFWWFSFFEPFLCVLKSVDFRSKKLHSFNDLRCWFIIWDHSRIKFWSYSFFWNLKQTSVAKVSPRQVKCHIFLCALKRVDFWSKKLHTFNELRCWFIFLDYSRIKFWLFSFF